MLKNSERGSQAGLSGERGQNEVYPVREGRENKAKGRKWSCLVGWKRSVIRIECSRVGGKWERKLLRGGARNRNRDKKGTNRHFKWA